MERSDERLRELMKTLADTIGAVVNENDDIRKTLAMMEQEGYPVNMIVASITMVSAIEEEDDVFEDDKDISYYDRSFLKKIHVKLGEEQ